MENLNLNLLCDPRKLRKKHIISYKKTKLKIPTYKSNEKDEILELITRRLYPTSSIDGEIHESNIVLGKIIDSMLDLVSELNNYNRKKDSIIMSDYNNSITNDDIIVDYRKHKYMKLMKNIW